MKAYGYVRISTGDQSSYSLQAQEEEIRAYCKLNNLELIKTFQDTKGRFTFEEREGLMSLIDLVESGKVNSIIITELDRLSGDQGILGFLKLTFKRNNVNLISINESEKAKDEYQELLESILTSIAKFENTRKKLRCRRGLKKARQSGRLTNRLPLGYKLEKGEVRIDPSQSEKIKEIFECARIGFSPYKIAKIKKMNRASVRYILLNDYYSDPNKNGKHETLIPKTLQKEVQNRVINTKI